MEYYISSGSTANNTTVNNSSCLYILSGGVANNTQAVGNSAYVYVSSGGVANNTTINGGQLHVSSGGRATVVYLLGGNGRGSNDVKNHGTIDDANIGEGGEYYVESGASANGAVISSGATLMVSKGAHATGIIASSGAALQLAVASDTYFEGTSDGNVLEMKNATLSNFVVEKGGAFQVYSGGMASDVVVSSGGSAVVSSGGTATGITASNGAYKEFAIASNTYIAGTSESSSFVFNTASLSDYVVGQRDIFGIHSGAVASNITIDGGQLSVYRDGYASGVVLLPGHGAAANDLRAYGRIDNATIGSGGEYYVQGVANDTTISSGGTLFLYNGGKLTGQMNFKNGAKVIASSGAIVDFDLSDLTPEREARLNNLSLVNGWSSANFTITVSGEQENGTYKLAENAADFNKTITVQNTLGKTLGTLTVGQTITLGENDFTLNLSNGILSLVGDNQVPFDPYSDQLIVYQTVNVFGGETYTNTTIGSNGRLNVSSGGTANNTTVNGSGLLYVFFGGIANKSMVNSGGVFYISSGGIANNTIVNVDGSMYVSSGGTVNNTTINSGGWLYVSSDGTALDIVWTPCEGHVRISDGGDATFVSEYSGVYYGVGNKLLSSASVMDDKTMHGYNCEMYVMNGGTANNTTVSSGAYLCVSSGGTVNSTTVYSSGLLCISSGGTANNTTVNGNNYPYGAGILYVFSGGVANNTTINYKGIFYVSSGGIAENVAVNGSGALIVFGGGEVKNPTVNVGGSLYLMGGEATDIVENGGYVSLPNVAGGITFASNTFSGSIGNSATVHSGTTASDIIIGSAGHLFVFSSGIASGATVNSGGGISIDKGEAYRTTINGYGVMHVSSGGIASIVTVQSNGRLVVSSGGIITGRMVFMDGSYISANTGGIFDFDISSIDSDASARYNNLSIIIGTPTYTLTVSDSQMDGTYTLANNVEGFNEIITVQNSLGEKLGTVSVDGKLTVGKACYSLKLSGNDLMLNISGSYLPDTTAPKISSIQANITTPTNQDVTISAVFTDNVQVTQTMYRLGPNGTWETYKDVVTVSENTTVYFKAKDAAGNESTVASYTVSNIDKVAPDKPTVSADITTLTNQDVNISAVFSKDTVKKEYKLNNGNWQTYSTSVKLTANGTVSFRGTDAAGNISEIASYTVDYIDKTAPTKPVATANTTEQTDQDVTVTATFSDDSEIKEYRLEGGKWTAYTEPVIFTENGTVYFRGTDAAGNVSEVTSYEVTNIEKVIPDTTPPTVSSIQANITALTNQDVVVTAQFDDNEELASAQYRIGEKGKWTLYTNGAILTENGTVYFKAIDAAGNESEVVSYTVSNIDKVAPSDPTGVRAFVERQDVALLWNVSMDDFSGVKEYLVTYSLNGQEFTARTANSNYVLNNADFGSYSWSVQAVDFAGNESALIAGDAFTVSGFKPYTVEYSADNFEHVITFAVTTPSLDAFRMPTGTYQMRVKQDGSSEWLTGDPIVAPETDIEPQLVKSDADSNADVFFANPIGTWESGYMAQHVGSTADPWGGTKEYASLYGKNKLADIIEGSTDANILLMTDDDNGDGLFVDDIYSALPGSVTEQQSRIAQIDEIRAGFGNDIVDMTSQRFEYIGEGLTIRGGEGNDIIWANKGDNFLFGDAGNDRIVGASGDDVIAGGIGNDRMHGGGGEDVFTFCENWGTDTVEQLTGGSVTLWFASGSEANWNPETLTYTDGDNSVKVSGVTADKITRIFGDDGSAQFATLSSMGAFFDATTERIFEESGKGILASL